MDELRGAPAALERAGHIEDHAQRLERRQRATLDPLSEGLAHDQFHGDVMAPIRHTRRINSHQVRMLQVGRHPRFPLKTGDVFGIGLEV